jgi:glycosyltransferase involved in cell wall biosynthesis
MPDQLHVLMITSEWPTPNKPFDVPFITRQVEYLRKAGVDLTVFPFRGGKSISRYAKAWKEAQSILQQGKFDLVHAQWGQSGLLALPKKIPLVVTFRGDDLEGIIGPSGRQTLQGKILRLLSRWVARKADQVIVVSESLGRQVAFRPYAVIPSGLNLNLFCPIPKEEARRLLRIPDNRYYVLFAGAVNNPRKQFDLAKKAVKSLRPELDVEILVANQVAHDQIPLYMNAADTLLLVSRHEGSPNVVKEALACNLPIVSTDVGDVKQRIGSISGCLVLQKDDLDSVKNALRQVLLQGKRIQGREQVIDLDETVLTQKLIHIYDQALCR